MKVTFENFEKSPATTACVIWLHGGGESGEVWRTRLKEGVSRLKLPWVDFLFPDAPVGGWIDFQATGPEAVKDEEIAGEQ